MSFNQIAESTQDNVETHLYEIQIGTTVWRYTSANTNINARGEVYRNIAIKHSAIAQSGDAEQDSLTLEVQRDIDLVTMFVGTPPTNTVAVRIRYKAESDNDSPVVYVGEIESVDLAQDPVQIRVMTLSATMQRNGLTMTYQRSCPLALYGKRCRVDRSRHAVPAQIVLTGLSTVDLYDAGGKPDGWFTGGIIEWETCLGYTDYRSIETHVGNRLAIFGLADGLEIGMRVTLYPGCSRDMITCRDKFQNIENYGGQAYLPGKSPFDGNPN